MAQLPKDLGEAIAQAREATQAAIADGYNRLQVDLAFSELKPMPVAQQFVTAFADLGNQLKVIFPDAGAAALARRDWGEVDFTIRGLGELRNQVQLEGQVFVLVAPTSAEVTKVEKLVEALGDRPLILLNPRLEDVGIVGIGYAARQLRDRFLNTFEPCYYLRPLEEAALLRCYPSSWQVWLEMPAGDYQLHTEVAQKPIGEDLERILAKAAAGENPQPSRKSFFTELQQFLRALTQ